MTLRRTLLALLPALAVLSLLAVLAADAAGGDNLVLLDAGPVARIGAPVAANLADLAAALTLGGAVVDVLLAAVEGLEIPQRTKIPPELIVRLSTAKARSMP